MFRKKDGDVDGVQVGIFLGVLFGLIILSKILFGPMYGVWEQGLSGQAELAKADYSKKVAVQEAQAKLDSSTLLANAEVERAKGVAKANEIKGRYEYKSN